MTKAIRFAHTGGPEVLSLEDITLPPPGPGEVRMKLAAIGVNFIDTYHRSGLYPVLLPSGLGKEGAGTITALGTGVTQFQEGDRVATCSAPLGMYAQECNVPAKDLVALPDGISAETAASGLLKGLTARYLLKQTFPVKAGQTIVVHAAAGGTGLLLTQWARHLGVNVIGTVGSEAKVGLAKEAGATHVIVLREAWQYRVRELTGGAGVPVVYDSIGKDTFEASLDCLHVRGMMVSFGNSSGAVPAFSPTLLSSKGSLFLTRPTLFHYIAARAELEAAANDFFAVLISGAVNVAVNQRFALSDAAKAHQALEGRGTTGATILIP
jgi:NADPH2:quinone reductase